MNLPPHVQARLDKISRPCATFSCTGTINEEKAAYVKKTYGKEVTHCDECIIRNRRKWAHQNQESSLGNIPLSHQ
jgi:hypothetical protein